MPETSIVAPINTDREFTLAGPATLEGTSLHTGQKVNITIKP